MHKKLMELIVVIGLHGYMHLHSEYILVLILQNNVKVNIIMKNLTEMFIIIN